MQYEIQSRTKGAEWRNDEVGGPNRFATSDDAYTAITYLRRLGEDWAAAEYRVIEIPESFQGRPETHPEMISRLQRGGLERAVAEEKVFNAIATRYEDRQSEARILAEDASDLARRESAYPAVYEKAMAKALASIALTLAFPR